MCSLFPCVLFDVLFPECNSSATSDLVFILDSSSAVTQSDFEETLKFVKNVLQHAAIDNGSVRVGVVTNSKRTKVRLKLSQFATKTEILDAVGKIPYEPHKSNLVRTLRTVRSGLFKPPGDRPEVKNKLVILTSHVPEMTSKKAINVAKKLIRSGVEIFGIGVGLPNQAVLSDIVSSSTEKHLLSIPGFTDLSPISGSIASKLCMGKLNGFIKPYIEDCVIKLFACAKKDLNRGCVIKFIFHDCELCEKVGNEWGWEIRTCVRNLKLKLRIDAIFCCYVRN